MSSFPSLGREDNKAPQSPRERDEALYGLHDGKLDENDDGPNHETDGQGTSGKAAPAGATAGVGNQPATDPKSTPVPASPNPEGAGENSAIRLGKELKQKWDDMPVHLGVGADTATGYPPLSGDGFGLHFTLNLPPYSQYVDPDAAGSSQVTMPAKEDLDAKFNGRKQPVNPNGGPDTKENIPPTHYRGSGLDPELTHVDNEIGTGGEGSSELSTKVTTAPIDYAPGAGAPGAGPTTGRDGDGADGDGESPRP